jgi:hypothetical protein
MTTDVVTDVSHDWLQACFVQGRFMRGPALNNPGGLQRELPADASSRRRLLRLRMLGRWPNSDACG